MKKRAYKTPIANRSDRSATTNDENAITADVMDTPSAHFEDRSDRFAMSRDSSDASRSALISRDITYSCEEGSLRGSGSRTAADSSRMVDERSGISPSYLIKPAIDPPVEISFVFAILAEVTAGVAFISAMLGWVGATAAFTVTCAVGCAATFAILVREVRRVRDEP